jgi:hypothetical protein
MNSQDDFICIFCNANNKLVDKNATKYCLFCEAIIECSGYARDRLRCPYWYIGDY